MEKENLVNEAVKEAVRPLKGVGEVASRAAKTYVVERLTKGGGTFARGSNVVKSFLESALKNK